MFLFQFLLVVHFCVAAALVSVILVQKSEGGGLGMGGSPSGLMSAITRSWIAFAAVGAGLIYLALSIASPPAVGALLALVGVVGFAWGVLVMFDERFLAPRIALVGALAPLVLWIATLLLSGVTRDAGLAQGFRPFPLAVATLLELFIAVAIALHLRRGRVAKPPTTGRFAIGVVLGILVIGALVAPALASTTLLVPSGSFEDGVHH